jgi:hypothetical protein
MKIARPLVLLAAAGLLTGLPACMSSPAPAGSPTAAIPKGRLKTPLPAGANENTTANAALEELAATPPVQPEGEAATNAKPSYAKLEEMIAEQTRLLEEYRNQQALKQSPTQPASPAVNPAMNPAPPAAPVNMPVVNAPALKSPAGTPGTNTAAAPIPAVAPPASAGLAALAGETTAPSTTTTPGGATGSTGVTGTGEPVVLAPATAPVEQRFTMAADELARALRERAASSRNPAADYAALAWLDTIRPGVLGSLDAVPASRLLDPRQIKSINVLREMLSRTVAEPALLSDHEKLWRSLSDAASPITTARDVRITTTELCTKVNGYGQYDTIPSRNLLAGTSHTLIVYAEVDSFAHRRTIESVGSGDSERYTVDLGQAVEIWQDADRPTLQKRWGETQVKDVSRRPRRDFYITTVIELPANLSVGAYNLKLIVKDRQRGAQAERTIPFTIIADGSLATAGN